MRRPTLAHVGVLLAVVIALPARAESGFVPSFVAGVTEADGQRLGGTEMRVLASHGGKLFAGNGYWEDRTGAGSVPGPQIFVLDAPSGTWRVDHVFGDLLPGGRRRHLAVSALADVTFRSDGRGQALPAPVSLLLASTWDITGARTVFVRDDRTGDWPGTVLLQERQAEGRPARGFLPQIRAFGFHRDRITGADLVFAGDTSGVFAGSYEQGRIAWQRTPEFATDLADSDFLGLSGRVRVSSFAEADGRLFAAIGQQIWVREDGAAPRWQLLYTNPHPLYSQTGLRGLTAVTGPDGHPALLAAVEGQRGRIVRIDPATGAETAELDLAGLLDRSWGTRVSYVIAAYNDMTRLPRPDGGEDLVIGLEAFIPPASPRPPGHRLLDVIRGLEAGGWFLLRHADGRYDLHQVTGLSQDLVAVRTAAVFPGQVGPGQSRVGQTGGGQAGVLFLGGYDANETPAHDTAWIAREVAGP